MNYSPLRYPGGKKKLAPFIAKICSDNSITEHFVEPYSGGAAVALFLLFEGFVKHITINDNDRSIYAFWYSVLNKTDLLCEMIQNTPVTIEEWKRQRNVQKNKENCGLLELGFSTFFLNRTNRSGIIKGGVIGGINQGGQYKLDCRYNKNELINRIDKIAKLKMNISIFNEDALNLLDMDFIKNSNPHNMLIYFDPPYYAKGQSLYTQYYKKEHHKIVCNKIKSLNNMNWIVSYDDADEIRLLYSDCQIIEYCINHTAFSAKKGKELIFLSPTIVFDPSKNPPQYKFKKKIQYIETDAKQTP
jgi:DNA adenine methylase